MADCPIPDKQHPKWRTVVLNCDRMAYKALVTKLLMMRVKMIIENETLTVDTRISQATELAHDFFIKNAQIVREDVYQLFCLNEDETL